MLAYPMLTIPEITALPVAELAEKDAHLYLWVTHRYIWQVPDIIHAWGFKISTLLTWCKAPTGFSLGGTFGRASEFVVFCRRGNLRASSRTNRDWWEWPRKGKHSAKPEAFQDMIEGISPGPYLELFARRRRMGWDTWGDELDGGVPLESLA